MTPQSRGLAAHSPRAFVRRSAVVVGALLAVVGAPLVASAIESESAVSASVESSGPGIYDAERSIPMAARLPEIPELGADLDLDLDLDLEPRPSPEMALPDAEPVREPIVDPIVELLIEDYSWGEVGPRIVALQEALGVAADGTYSYATQRAHRAALVFLDEPIDGLPVPLAPPGTDETQWAALRECESNGDYTIVSSSGTYRGAYQFGRRTWDSVAGRSAPLLVGVDPAAAAPADQDLMAFALYSERGASPWPVCGRHLR